MDGTRSVHSVKPKTTQEPQEPSLPREKKPTVEPLTPLHRLARFKAVRDRNLARAAPPSSLPPKLARASSSIALDQSNHFARPAQLGPAYFNRKRQSIMDTQVNGVSKIENQPLKVKAAEKLTNGKDSAQTNGVEQANGTNGLNPEPVAAKQNVVQPKVKQPKEDAKVEPPTAAVAEAQMEAESDQNEPPTDDGAEAEVDADEKESVSDGDQGSEGSSLDVVGESSSGESLDLQVSGGVEAGKDPGPSATSSEDKPIDKPPTPEVIRRIRAGGEIKSRPKREYHSPSLKRKLGDDDDDDTSGGKRSRDDGTAGSPGWTFFSPSKIVNRLWSPSKAPSIDGPDENLSLDDSMAVNFDDRSRYYDVGSAQEVFEAPPKPAHRWCSLM